MNINILNKYDMLIVIYKYELLIIIKILIFKISIII